MIAWQLPHSELGLAAVAVAHGNTGSLQRRHKLLSLVYVVVSELNQ